MRIENFLSSDAFTIVNKKLAKLLWIWKAIYLQELISQRKRFKQDEFFFTQNDMAEELGINYKTQQRYLKELVNQWLISVDRKWLPAKNYYKINDEIIYKLLIWETSMDKMSTQYRTECPNYSYNSKNDTKKESKENFSNWNKCVVGKDIKELFRNLTFSDNVIERIIAYNEDARPSKSKLEKLTERWLKIFAKELKEYWWDDEWMILVLQQSIANWWQWIFPLKDKKQNKTNQQKRPETRLEWIQELDRMWDESSWWKWFKEKYKDVFDMKEYQKLKSEWVQWRMAR